MSPWGQVCLPLTRGVLRDGGTWGGDGVSDLDLSLRRRHPGGCPFPEGQAGWGLSHREAGPLVYTLLMYVPSDFNQMVHNQHPCRSYVSKHARREVLITKANLETIRGGEIHAKGAGGEVGANQNVSEAVRIASVAVASGRADPWDPCTSVAEAQTRVGVEIIRWDEGDLPAQAQRAE